MAHTVMVITTIALGILTLSSCNIAPNESIAESATATLTPGQTTVSEAVPEADSATSPSDTQPPPATLTPKPDVLLITVTPEASVVAFTDTAAPEAVVAVIDVASLNIRGGPGVGYPVLGQVRGGRRYVVLGKSSLGEWFELNTEVGRGWVFARYVLIEGDIAEVAVTAQDLPPLALPGVSPATNSTSVPPTAESVAPTATSHTVPTARPPSNPVPTVPTSTPAPTRTRIVPPRPSRLP